MISNKDISTAKLIMKKSSTSLKISVMMLVISLMVISSMSIIYMNQYYQMDKDFISNVAVHTIKLEQIQDKENGIERQVVKTDIEEIKQIMSQYGGKVDYKVTPCESNATGLYLKGDENCVKLTSIDKDKGFLIGDDLEIEDDVLYSYQDLGENLTLVCDRVNLEECTSYDSFEIKMPVKQSVSDKSPVVLLGNINTEDTVELFVSNTTFEKIISKMTSNSYIVSNEQAGIVNTEGIYMYIEDVTLVNKISKYLENKGVYNTCTFDAFEDMGESLDTTKILFTIIEIVVLLMGIIQTYLAFNAFYKVQQKDMGILKYHGYTKQRVYGMYSYNIKRIFLVIAMIIMLSTIVLGYIVLGKKYYKTTLMIMLLMFIVVIFVMELICKFVIKKYTDKETLVLIKSSKEFQ